MVHLTGEIQAGILSIRGGGLFTPLISYTYTNGSIITSTSPEKREFSSRNIGFNGHYAGAIALHIGRIAPEAGIEYSIYTYGTETNRYGVQEIYAVQREDYIFSFAITFTQNRMGIKDLRLGASWLTSEERVPEKPALSFFNGKIRIDIGFTYGE